MSKHSIVITLAIWIIVLPFLGFPSFWRTLLIVLSSLGIIFYTFILRSEYSNGSSWSFSNKDDVYIENGIDQNAQKTQKKK
ncbi:MAG: hypothetical protein ISR98_00915 [Parcubacteria group bacterium]|nr:hypothetical protein [Parcubacteria group bacterium]